MLLRGWCTLATIVLPFVTARSLRGGHDVERLECVQSTRGLVHKDESRIVQQVHTDGDALTLAAGDAADLFVPHDRLRGADQAEVRDYVLHRRLLRRERDIRPQSELRGEEQGLADRG